MTPRRIFITGSADGLGLEAGRQLIADGHEVWLHARNEARADDARANAPGAAGVLVGDLTSIAQTTELATAANATSTFDAVIHNAGIYVLDSRTVTGDGLEQVFQVNVLAPYLLTAVMHRPERLVYLSSGMHQSGEIAFDDLQWERRAWDGAQAYSDSKLLDVVLACEVASRWMDVRSNAVDPGWAATRMGGAGAPVTVEQGAATQAWLAASDDGAAAVSGCYFRDRKERRPRVEATDPLVQHGLLDACAELTGVEFPE